MSTQQEDQQEVMTAIVGIFSGRPNPEVTLSGKVVEEFAQRMQGVLGKEAIHAPPAPRLGYYYGFRVTSAKVLVEKFGVPAEFRVYHGVITTSHGKEECHWRDLAELENYLVEQAYDQGYGEMLEKVGMGRPEEAAK